MKLLQTALFLAICTSAFSQYAFENKKAEKLYYKLDDAYLDYDYNKILDEEETIKEVFLSKEDTVAANMYSFLGEAYYFELNQLQKALEFYNLELELRSKVQPGELHKDLLFSIANIQTELGFFSQAEGLIKQVRESDREEFGKNSQEYFESTTALIELYLQTEQVSKGLETTKNLQKEVVKNTIEEGVTYKWTGDAYAIEGSFKKAEKNLVKGIRTFEENGLEATFEYASTLNSLGVLYMEKGKLPEAEEIFDQALSILNRIQGENEDAIAGVENNLALVYFNLGDYERTLELQRRILEQDKEYYGEDSFTYGLSLLNLGLTLLYDEQYAEAEKLHQEAMEVFAASAGEESIDYGRVENNLTLLNTRQGNIDQAIDYGNRAIKTYEATLGNEHPETAFPYFNLANAHLGYEEVDKAVPLAKRAYDIRKKTLGEKHPHFARSANQLAIINWKQGNTDEAMGYYKETFDNYFNQINTFFPVLTEEEKATFYYTKLKPGFEQYISFIEETSREDKELIGEIYNYQLALKGLIMYATSKVRESILSSGNEALIEKYENWVSQKEQLAKLFSVTDLSLEQRNKKIDSLTKISNALEEELSKESNVFSKNFANRNLTWQDVQKTLKPGEAAVEIVRYRDFSTDSSGVFTDEVHYAALIVKADTEDFPEMVIMRNGAQMEKKYLANYRNAIKYKIAENYSYRLFWRPIANRLGDVKKIYFSPDGVYNQISIYTLRNPQTKDYLINELDLSIVTNTKDLVAEAETNNGSNSIFFGYPNYNMGTDEKVEEKNESGGRGMRSGGTGTLERGATIPRGIRGNLVRYMRSFNGLGMLPGTKKEVELIDSLYSRKSIEAEVYLLEEAVENKIKAIENPSTLHIATHGFFLELDPDDASNDKYVENPLLRSGLVLAGANSFIRTGELDERQGTDDGILTAFEAMNLNLDETDIVVLSACETGLGEIKNGEGVYGLQRAFQIAGADAIIMSMWTVDDAATQELMTNFYEEWLSHGDKRRAFNTAQKRLKEKYDRPYYWGAFVMVGE